jgi:Caspase domain
MADNSPDFDDRPIRQCWAFLVGINSYHEPRLSPLRFCVNDVRALGKMLTKLGYSVIDLYDRHPQIHRQPTRTNVYAELQSLCQQVGEEDLLFVHFACHGKLGRDGQPFLMMQDSRLALWEKAEERLSVAQVEQVMKRSRASRLFLSLDACHVGVEMGRGMESDPEFIRNVYERAEGFVVMAGSTAQQQAMEWEAVEHGVYTFYLLEALSGKADREGKAFVSVDDVEKYVVHHLRRWGVENGGVIQEPTIKKEGMGDMIVADWRDRDPIDFGVSSFDRAAGSRGRCDGLRAASQIPQGSGERRRFYEKELARKQTELAAVEDDLEICGTRKQELRLRKDAEQILKEIEDLNGKLLTE